MVHARLVTMVVVLALGALTLGAGPAAAAQGGNDDTAHACQQGGWANLTDPATGQPFTSQGACVSSGAHGKPAAERLAGGLQRARVRRNLLGQDHRHGAPAGSGVHLGRVVADVWLGLLGLDRHER